MQVETGHYRQQRLPIWRDSQQLLLEVETAVRSFPRYHKYTVGSELRKQAMRVCQILSRALMAKNTQRVRRVEQLAELAVAIGKQGGAWLRRLSSSGARPASQAS